MIEPIFPVLMAAEIRNEQERRFVKRWGPLDINFIKLAKMKKAQFFLLFLMLQYSCEITSNDSFVFPAQSGSFGSNLCGNGTVEPNTFCFLSPQLVSPNPLPSGESQIHTLSAGIINEKTGGIAIAPPDGDFVAMANNFFRVGFGEGDGTFTGFFLLNFNDFHDQGKSTLIRDFNNDGFSDIITGGELTGGEEVVRIFWGSQDNDFSLFSDYSIPVGLGGKIQIANLNGDEFEDFVVRGTSGGEDIITIALGQGNGNFSFTSIEEGFNAPQEEGIFQLSDCNNDGRLDLVYGGINSNSDDHYQIRVHFNNGNGNFGNPHITDNINRLPNQNTLDILIMNDLNKDGNIDFIASTTDNGAPTSPIRLIRGFGNGNGTFNSIAYESSFSQSNSINRAFSHDFDKDGNLDFILCHHSSNSNEAAIDISIYRGHGNGNFSLGRAFIDLPGMTKGAVYSPDLTLTDFNHDGAIDIMYSGRGNNRVYVILANP